MIPKTASSCNPKPCILGENPHRRKTQGGQNDALREKTAASFLGLQSRRQPDLQKKEILWAVCSCRGRSRSFKLRKAGGIEARASRSGGPKGPESRAADGCWCCSGSQSCKGRSRQRKAAGECEGEGATTLNVERQDAANVAWAAEAAEVGRTGNLGVQSPDC
ncbi:hypothetical protein DER44DRAFT_890304 [Fusarium oxysporum]|nr:hypothetical protein DER44DRAFT_890304 [Fusarium oxysporum]